MEEYETILVCSCGAIADETGYCPECGKDVADIDCGDVGEAEDE